MPYTNSAETRSKDSAGVKPLVLICFQWFSKSDSNHVRKAPPLPTVSKRRRGLSSENPRMKFARVKG